MSSAAAPFDSLQIAVNAVSDPCGGCLDGVTREMGVASGGLNLGMAQQLSDHRQPLAKCEGPRGKAMAEVVDAHVVEFRFLPYTPPGVLKVGQVAARFPADDHPRVVRLARQGLQ